MNLHDLFTLLILSIGTSGYDMTVIAQNDTSLPMTTFLCFRRMSTLHESH